MLRRGELLGPWDRCRTHPRASPDTFARRPSWRPMFDDQSSGRRGQRSAPGPRARGGCGACLARRRGRVNAVEAREVRIWSAAPDLRRGPPGRRMGLGVPEKLRGAGFFACVYRFMPWTGPGKPLTARGGCYGAVMICGREIGRFAQCVMGNCYPTRPKKGYPSPREPRERFS